VEAGTTTRQNANIVENLIKDNKATESVELILSDKQSEIVFNESTINAIIEADVPLMVTSHEVSVEISAGILEQINTGGDVSVSITTGGKALDSSEGSILNQLFDVSIIVDGEDIGDIDGTLWVVISLGDEELSPEEIDALEIIVHHEDGTETILKGVYDAETDTLRFELIDLGAGYEITVGSVAAVGDVSTSGGFTTTAQPNALVLSETTAPNDQGVLPFIMRNVSEEYNIGMISLRAFADFVGATPAWDGDTGTATVTGLDANFNPVTVSMVSGSNIITVNGQDYDIGEYAGADNLSGLCTAYNENGSLYLPLRAVTNAFGGSIDWDGVNATINK
jgi:hypothetical protein